MNTKKKLLEKWEEALAAVLPVILIVMLLCFTISPISPSILLCFLMGAVLLLIGMMFFSLGAEIAMTPMGERVGSCLMESRKLSLIIPVAFILGFIITVSEPDLQVLAEQVPSIPNLVLIGAVAAGVGIFLVAAFLRMMFSVALPPILTVLYCIVFVIAFFVPKEFLAVAFDSGGVTTGPMTVPFIMALGVGACAVRSDKHASVDSFGLVALCSVGPILAVMILGMVFSASGTEYVAPTLPEIESSVELWQLFAKELPQYMGEIAGALLPIIVAFGFFQLTMVHLKRAQLAQTVIGLFYTFVGLVLFLTGANVGFVPAGNYIGQMLAAGSHSYLLIPVGMVLGYFIVKAEPAVYVLNKQVEDVTDGAISAGAMGVGLSVGVAVSVGLAMVRVVTGISILWFLLPGYAIAVLISFFVPKIYTAIAFDSGGVASGPMTAAFLLPLAQGACTALGGNIVTDAFGVVAMVAMTPLITIQVLGLCAKLRSGRADRIPAGTAADAFSLLPDDAVIEL